MKKKVFKDVIVPGLEWMNELSEDHPLPGVQYQITGGPGDKCLSNGNTWKQSKIITNKKKGI